MGNEGHFQFRDRSERGHLHSSTVDNEFITSGTPLSMSPRFLIATGYVYKTQILSPVVNFALDANSPFVSDSPMDEVVKSLSPCTISSIPAEVLVFIFGLVPSPHSLPVTLSHVCKSWRALSLGTPKLWSRIVIHEEYTIYITHFLTTLLRVQHCLTRSGSHALTLDIVILKCNVQHYSEPVSSKLGREALNSYSVCVRTLSAMLGAHTWRFRSFKLLCDEFSTIVDVQSCFPSIQMQLLEVWDIHQRDEIGEVEAQAMEDKLVFISIADLTALSIPLVHRGLGPETGSTMFPRLRTATISATPLDWSRFAPRNLQSLDICYLPKPACPDGETLRQILLANAHSLTTLKLHGAAPATRAKEPYLVPTLQRLDLGCVYPDELIPFLEDIHFPNLESLAIENLFPLFMDHDNTSLFQSLMNCLPITQLRSLELKNICFVPDHSDSSGMRRPIDLLPDLSNLVVPAITFEFFCKLRSLKDLTLLEPDMATLNVLNHIPVGVGIRDGSAARIPIPSLDILRLERSDREYAEREQIFLRTRIARRNSLLPINQIMFVRPGGWDSMEARDWICETFRSIDVLSLAKKFEYLETEQGFQVCLSR